MRFRSILLLVAAAIVPQAHAVTLDWSTETWTPGSLSNSYHVDPGTVGNDLTVTVSGDTSTLQPGLVSPNPQTPAITQAFQGGFAQPVSSLELAVVFANNTQQITVTIDFAAHYALGVNNVSFTLFDIDTLIGSGSNFQDKISGIQATSTDGITQIAPTISAVGPFATLAGTGFNQTLVGNAFSSDLGNGSGNGNATISFGGQAIRSLTFTYSSGPDPQGASTYQHIGLYNLAFTPVPEMNPAWLGTSACCFAGAWVGWVRRRSARVHSADNAIGRFRRICV
jgi:hypothetical protein